MGHGLGLGNFGCKCGPRTQGLPETSQECPEASRPRYCASYQKASALPYPARASRKRATLAQATNTPLPKTMDFPSHCMRSCVLLQSEKPCAPAFSQIKTAYKCCFKASQPTVHSSAAMFVKRRESSQKPCAPRVSLLLGRLYTAWGDFLPLPCFAVCRRGWADFTPSHNPKPQALPWNPEP